MSRVLADTSVWVRHFRRADVHLQSLLADDRLLVHPLIVLELACGTPPAPRERTLSDLRLLPETTVAKLDEVFGLVERHRLWDSGCGAVDTMLLASTLLTPEARLWTDDRALDDAARRLGVAYPRPTA